MVKIKVLDLKTLPLLDCSPASRVTKSYKNVLVLPGTGDSQRWGNGLHSRRGGTADFCPKVHGHGYEGGELWEPGILG